MAQRRRRLRGKGQPRICKRPDVHGEGERELAGYIKKAKFDDIDHHGTGHPLE
jgi:hypothetical protein